MKTTIQLISIALLTTLSCSVASAATTFDGSGGMDSAANWDNGLPTNANPGLVSGTTAGSWSGAVWTDFAVLQTGGELFAAGDGGLNMRGGAEFSGNTTIFEINDASNTSFATTNLAISGTLIMWGQFAGGGGHELSLLNGYADIGSLSAISNTSLSAINIGNGKLDIGSFTQVKVTFNMLAGGTGQFNLAEADLTDTGNADLGNAVLNFVTGSEVTFTIVSGLAGADASDYWSTNFSVGDVQIDGVNVADLSGFTIVDSGPTGTTISLIPEPGSYALLAGCFALASVMIRRRRSGPLSIAHKAHQDTSPNFN
jgi:hypothetical protein